MSGIKNMLADLSLSMGKDGGIDQEVIAKAKKLMPTIMGSLDQSGRKWETSEDQRQEVTTLDPNDKGFVATTRIKCSCGATASSCYPVSVKFDCPENRIELIQTQTGFTYDKKQWVCPVCIDPATEEWKKMFPIYGIY